MSFLNPIRVLDEINLRENFTVADFGSGSGGWVFPLARKIKEGTVYAIDLDTSPLSVLKKKAKEEELFNIKTITADVEEGSQLPDSSCDLVLMTNVLFAVQDKKGVLEEGFRVLKEGGHLLVVDWKKESPMKTANLISSNEVGLMADEIGLDLVKKLSAGIYHWGLFFRK